MAERQHPDNRDVDAIFESIVARFDETPVDEPHRSAPTGATRPSEPSDPSDPTAPVEPAAPVAPAEPTNPINRFTPRTGAPRPPRRQSTGDVHGPFRPAAPRHHDEERIVPWRTDPSNSVADALLGADAHPGFADEDEGFTPAPPAPLPPLSDRLFWCALAGLVLGPLGLLWLVLTRSGGFWSTALVISLTIGGFTALVLRQPTDRGDDPDNGARV